MLTYSNPKVVFIFNRLGPYQQARIEAVASVVSTIGIEISYESNTYFWDSKDIHKFKHYTLTAGSESAFYKAKAIKSILNKLLPTHVFIPGWSSSFSRAALNWCMRNGAEPILMADSLPSKRSTSHPIEIVKKQIIKLFRLALTAGSPHVSFLSKMGMDPKNVMIGYDVVDNDHFSKHAEIALQNRNLISNKFNLPIRYFLSVGRFLPVKNFINLIHAYMLYLKKCKTSPTPLLIVGKGPMDNLLKEEIKSLNLNHNILIRNWANYEDLPYYYALSDCLIVPSTSETWGLVVNEAMASSKPVIVSNECGCIDDLVHHGKNGFIFDPHNITELSELMLKIDSIGYEKTKLGKEGYEIIKNWSPKLFSNSVLNLLSIPFEDKCSDKFRKFFWSLILSASLFFDISDPYFKNR